MSASPFLLLSSEPSALVLGSLQQGTYFSLSGDGKAKKAKRQDALVRGASAPLKHPTRTTVALATLGVTLVSRSLTRRTLGPITFSPMALWIVPLHLFPITMRPHFPWASCML
jgi:hypothetical protein